jgi:hypothetical protein
MRFFASLRMTEKGFIILLQEPQLYITFFFSSKR